MMILLLNRDKFNQFQNLIPSHGILTYTQADAIMHIASMKLGGMQRSLREEMLEKYVLHNHIDAMRKQIDGLSLAQATQTILPRVKPLGFNP